MGLPLLEASKLSNDVLLQGVIETVIQDSPILQMLPFVDIVGNGLTYNRENSLGSANWYDPDEVWSETNPTFTQLTAVLRILGTDADVDNYIKATRQNVQDIEAAVIELKSKAVRHEFEEAFIYGDNAANPKQFDGIRKLINTGVASAQVIAAGATGATLTLSMLDQLIDAVKGGKPDLLLMSKRSRRKINALVRAAGGTLETWPVKEGAVGAFVQLYNGVPVGVSDFILDTHTVAASVETATTGDTSSVIYALKFGEGAVSGLQGAGGLTVERIGSLETKDATRTRVKWYCSLADFSTVRRAALIGVQD